MDDLRMLIAVSDPYHLLMSGWALGVVATLGAFWLVAVARRGHER